MAIVYRLKNIRGSYIAYGNPKELPDAYEKRTCLEGAAYIEELLEKIDKLYADNLKLRTEINEATTFDPYNFTPK